MRTGVKLVAALGLSALLGAGAPDAPVADAAMRGDLTMVRALLEKGADVNAAQGDGMSALHWAAQNGDRDMAQLLVHAGASVDAVTRIALYTPLHLASRNGNVAVMETLIEAGSNVKAATSSGAQSIHFAAESGAPDAVTLLLDHGADANALESEWGQTPLIFAAALDRAQAIKVLLARGADPKIASRTVDLVKKGKLEDAANRREREVREAAGKDATPSPAQVQGALAAARQIIVSGVIPERKEEKKDSSRTNNNQNNQDDEGPPAVSVQGGLTPLLHAARQGYIEAAVALLDGGSDVNQPSGDKTTPLLMAVINGQFDMAMMLIARKADPNLAADLNGVFPLWAAVNAQWQPRTRFPQPQEMLQQKATYLDVMNALLDAGANPNARTTGHPWYMVYTGCGNRNCGLADSRGSTAFWRAAYAVDVDAMRLLVARGADPNLPTLAPPRQRRGRDGATGQDVQQTDASGLPAVPEGGPGSHAIHAAAGIGYGEGFAGNAHRYAPDGWMPAVRYLVEELGADVNARDNNGYAPLHHAAARGDDEMILYLLQHGADIQAVSRKGQTVADMANGPVSRVSPFPGTVALLERLGSKNNHHCLSC